MWWGNIRMRAWWSTIAIVVGIPMMIPPSIEAQPAPEESIQDTPGETAIREPTDVPEPSDARSARERSLETEKRLAQRFPFHFEDTPLVQVLDVLAVKLQTEFLIDGQALNAESIDMSSNPITCHFKSIRGDQLLEHLLTGLNLTYEIQDGIICLTNKEQARSMLRTWVYQCADLIPQNDDHGDDGNVPAHPPAVAYAPGRPAPIGPPMRMPLGGYREGVSVDGQVPQNPSPKVDLATLIISSIEPGSWEDNGGVGTIRVYDRQFLVISQTYIVHRKVSSLLENLRAVRAGRSAGEEGTIARE